MASCGGKVDKSAAAADAPKPKLPIACIQKGKDAHNLKKTNTVEKHENAKKKALLASGIKGGAKLKTVKDEDKKHKDGVCADTMQKQAAHEKAAKKDADDQKEK